MKNTCRIKELKENLMAFADGIPDSKCTQLASLSYGYIGVNGKLYKFPLCDECHKAFAKAVDGMSFMYEQEE